MVSDVSRNLYSLPCILDIYVAHCYIPYDPSPADVCLYVDTNSHVVEVYVFRQDILHPTGGFASYCDSSEWG